MTKGKKGGKLRKTLVVVQFAASIIIIILALVWKKQTDFVYKADFGFNKNNVLVVPISFEAQSNYSVIKEELMRNPGVISVAASVNTPGRWKSKSDVIPEGKSENESLRAYTYGVNYEFFETLDMKVITGRTFSKDVNDENHFLINQLFADRLGWENPLGKTLKVNETEGTIVGVISPFHFAGFFSPKAPSLFFLEQKNLNTMLIKTAGAGNIPGIRDDVKNLWSIYSPNIPLQISKMDEYLIELNFRNTTVLTEMIGSLGGVAIFFSCMGLLALASYSVRHKTKEIGIRKVHGASVSEIVFLLGKDFLKLVLVANIIALPLAYFISVKLLEIFTIRTTIGIAVYIIAVFITLFFSLSVIGTQTIKAAKANPVDSLKYE